MRNANKFLKLYDEAVQERYERLGVCFPYRTWEEVHAEQQRVFDRYLKGQELTEKTVKQYIDFLASAFDGFGFYLAFQARDCELLNNVLYQNARRNLLSGGMTASGTDHGNVYYSLTDSFCCNDFAVFERFFPKHLPLTKSPFYDEPAMNLIKVMYYREQKLESTVLAQAEKFLKKKSPVRDKAVVHYLIALMKGNAETASEALEQACKGLQRSQTMGSSDKCFATEIHALYRFARFVDKSLFEAITSPDYPSFSAEFEAWQKEHDYPQGQMFYHYPPEMDFMNQIFNSEIPEVTVYEDRRNQYLKDSDKFLTELTELVRERTAAL